MSDIETRDVWPQIVRLADALPLAELARRFGVTPGEISAALERTSGRAAELPMPGAAEARGAHAASSAREGAHDVLPPEPGAARPRASSAGRKSLALAEVLPEARVGSKDARLLDHAHLLGQVPDAEVARLAGVSIRTVASYRARHDIPGYTGPRRAAGARGPRRSRLDGYTDLLGAVPDRVVAERAGVSLNAVRNYRVKRGIAALGRPATAGPVIHASGTLAWQITWRVGGALRTGVLLCGGLHQAVAQAEAAGRGDVVGVVLAGAVLAD